MNLSELEGDLQEIDEAEEDCKVLILFRSKVDTLKARFPYELPIFHKNDVLFYKDESAIKIRQDLGTSTGTCGSVLFGTVNGFPVAFKALTEKEMCRTEYIEKLVTEAAYQYMFNALSQLFNPADVMAVPGVLGFARLLEDEMSWIGNKDHSIVIVMQKACGETVHQLELCKSIDRLAFPERVKLYGKLTMLLVATCKCSLAHNDIHERNIMMDVDTAVVHLLDFGFAHGGIQPKTDIFTYIFGKERLANCDDPQYEQMNQLQSKIMATTSFAPDDTIFDELSQLCGTAFVREAVFQLNKVQHYRIIARPVKNLAVTKDEISFSLDEISFTNRHGASVRMLTYAASETLFNAKQYRSKRSKFSRMIKALKADATKSSIDCFNFVSKQLKTATCPGSYARWCINSAYLEVVVAIQYAARGEPIKRDKHFKFAEEDIRIVFTSANFAIPPMGRAKLFYFLAYIYYYASNISLARRYASEAHRYIIGSKDFDRNLKLISKYIYII